MKDMDDKKQLFTMRALIIVFIAVSVVIAIIQYKSNITFIAQLMGVSWGALAGAFLAPFLYGLYWKKATKDEFYLRLRPDDAQYAVSQQLPRAFTVAHQCRCSRDADWSGAGSGGKHVYQEAGGKAYRGCICLL